MVEFRKKYEEESKKLSEAIKSIHSFEIQMSANEKQYDMSRRMMNEKME